MARIRFDDRGIDAAQKRLEKAGLDTIRATAASVQAEAQRLAPVDSGELRRGVILIPETNGAAVVSTAPHSEFVEWGTGQYGERPGRNTSWVYKHPEYGFITTNGMRPQPFFRPSVATAKATFETERRRRGL